MANCARQRMAVLHTRSVKREQRLRGQCVAATDSYCEPVRVRQISA